MMSKILLAVPVFLPLIGGMVFLAWPDGRGKRSDWLMAVLIEGLVAAVSLVTIWLLFHRPEVPEKLVLFKLYGNLTVMFKLDAMGSVFAGLVAFLWPLSTLFSFEYMKDENRKASFFAFYTMTYGVTMGIALSGNLITMYLFYEMLTLVTFPLVLYPMTKEAVRASRKYLYYSIGGAAFAFIGLVFVVGYTATGTTEFLPGGVLDPAAALEKKNVLLLIYVLAFFGFGVKAALFPCHGWLPKATVAPTPVTALLHAVAVVKSGAFAILRFTYFSYGTWFLRGTWAQWFVMAASMVSIVFGSTMAVREVHWKRRLAYSTTSNLSYIVFGATMMSPLGLAAALSHMVAHAFMKICAFFCAGSVMHQTGKNYVYELDGLGKRMPVTFGCLTVASLSLMGIPLFAGFISKWNLCRSAFDCAGRALEGGNQGGFLPYAGVFVILYSALMTGIYMLTVLVRAYFPRTFWENDQENVPGGVPRISQKDAAREISEVVWEESGQKAGSLDPNWMMTVPLLIFAAAILIIGLHSAPLMRLLTAIGGEAG